MSADESWQGVFIPWLMMNAMKKKVFEDQLDIHTVHLGTFNTTKQF